MKQITGVVAATLIAAGAVGAAAAEAQSNSPGEAPGITTQIAAVAADAGARIEAGARVLAHEVRIAAGDAWAATNSAIAAGEATLRKRQAARAHEQSTPQVPETRTQND